MDPPNVREALKEALLDLEEGADMLMVKPALPYLDVLRAVKEQCDVPVAAYCVSGEYAMIKAAAQSGWLDEKQAVMEALIGSVGPAPTSSSPTMPPMRLSGWRKPHINFVAWAAAGAIVLPN